MYLYLRVIFTHNLTRKGTNTIMDYYWQGYQGSISNYDYK